MHANGNHVSLQKPHKNALVQIPKNPLPTRSNYIHSFKKKKPTTHNATGPKGGKTVGVPGLVLFRHQTGDWTHIPTFRTIRTQTLLCFFVVVVVFILSSILSQRLLFFCKRPQKADFGRGPSGLERPKSVRMEENRQAGNNGGQTNMAADAVGSRLHQMLHNPTNRQSAAKLMRMQP